MNDIKIFKLVDGTFIIGKLNKDEKIEDGIEMMMVPGQMSQMSMAMVPLMYPFNQHIENDILIDSNKVIMNMDAPDDIISKYIEATTGIVSAKSIVTH